MPSRSHPPAAIVALVVAALVTAGGCGTKTSGPTIGQLRDRALREQTPAGRARELVKVARVQARSGDKGGAAATLSTARGLLGPQSDADPAAGSEPPVDAAVAGPLLVEIAGVFALVGERGSAKAVLGQAVALVPRIDDALAAARLLAEAGGVYGAKAGGLGDAAGARAVLAQARARAAEVEERFRPEALAAVATAAAAAGLAAEAAAAAADLETLARGATGRARAEALAVAAAVRGRTGAPEDAGPLLDEAGQAARAIDDPENQAYALVSVARATRAVGGHEAALRLLDDAERAAGRVGDADAQRTALEKIRAARAELGRQAGRVSDRG